MGLQLADPVTERLARSPLTLVVCQVRHERNPAVGDPKRALAVHEAVKSSYPSFDENATQDLNMIAGSGGIQALPAEMNRGWRFKSEDDAWTAVVMPDFFALETNSYKDWPDFRDRLAILSEAIARVLEPSIERRIGLRYVDQMTDTDVKVPSDWRGRIDDALLGVIAHSQLGTGVAASQGSVQLQVDEHVKALLRHGCIYNSDVGDPCVYVLDYDCSREVVRPFNAPDVMGGVEELHTAALQLFQASLTPDYFKLLLSGS